MPSVRGAVQGLGSAADGAMLRVDVLDVGFEHIVAGDADAVNSLRRLLSIVSGVRVVVSAVVLRIVVAHRFTVSSCDAPMTARRI